MSIMELQVNQSAQKACVEKKCSLGIVLSALFSRVALFILFQFLLFAGFKMANVSSPWEQSANWWTLNVSAANLVCMLLLHTLLKREGKKFRDFFEFKKGEIIKNYLVMSGILLLCMPVAYLPNILLGNMLFGDYMKAVNMVYRPMPVWAAWLQCFIFPLTMPLGELTLYFGYVMPRLQIITKKKWLALTLPVLMLAFQHAALPLLFDTSFVLWRLLMFVPFALLIGLLIWWKPKLLPYLLVGHILIDIMNAVSILTVSIVS